MKATQTVIVMILSGFYASLLAAAEIDVQIHYLEQTIERPPTRSQLIVWPEDDGEVTLMCLSKLKRFYNKVRSCFC